MRDVRHFKKLQFHCDFTYSKVHKNYCTYILDKMLMLMHIVNREVSDGNIFKVSWIHEILTHKNK